jgi:uncharacterized RDD family membrane protein YckC
MTCNYCGSRNDEHDHRCRRCGRKPGDSLSGQFTVQTTGALAYQPQMVAQNDELPPTRTSNFAGAVQRSLFTPNVIDMPYRPAPRPAPRPRAASPANGTKPAIGSKPANGTKPLSRRTSRPTPEGQGQFEFFEPLQPKAKTLGTTVDAVIYCEAPVASPVHRALAGAIDVTMVLLGYGLFLLTFALCGGTFVIDRPNLFIYGAAFVVIAATYGIFWTIARTESVGLRWTHLRLITFDGFQPDPWQRVARLAGLCLSVCSVLGILWSLADEEGLGWQDHISGTFPTPHELESRVFRRR